MKAKTTRDSEFRDVLNRSSDLPKLAIDDIVQTQKQKDQIYSFYYEGDRPSFYEDDTTPQSLFSRACIRKKIPPVPVLAQQTGHKLVLNRYTLHAPLCEALGDCLPEMKKIRYLHLDENGITDRGGSFLIHGLKDNEFLTSFYYTKNDVGRQMAEAFDGLVKGRRSNLEEISFNGCRVQGAAFGRVLGLACKLSKLRFLGLSGIGLSDTVIDALSKSINSSNIQKLDASRNRVTTRGTKLLFGALRRNNTLHYLNYAQNNLAYDQCQLSRTVARFIRKSRALMHLDLTETGINDRDGRVIVRAMSDSLAMIGIHLSHNNFSRGAILEFSQHLKFSQVLDFVANSAGTIPFNGQRQLPPPDLPSELSRYEETESESPYGYKPRIIKHPYNLKYRDTKGRRLVYHQDNILNLEGQSKDILEIDTMGTLVFSRVLGREEEGYETSWKLGCHCWICEKWSFETLSVDANFLEKVEEKFLPVGSSEESSLYGIRPSFNHWDFIAFKDQEVLTMNLLIPPGDHHYWVTLGQEFYTSSAYPSVLSNGSYVNTQTVPLREEDPLHWAYKREKVERKFIKRLSVFRDFIEDDDQLNGVMMANDNKYSKIARVVKDESEYSLLMKSIQQHYTQIKEVFDFYMASSNFPSIGWLDFTDITTRTGMVDKKHLNVAAVDQIFKAVNFEVVSLDDNPDRDLCRYEFFEILVRMALVKYQTAALNPQAALEKLLNDHLFPHSQSSNAIASRWDVIYTVPVNDTLEINFSSIKTLFNKLKGSAPRYLKLDTLRETIQRIDPNFREKDFIRAYQFSKMSIKDEMENADLHEKILLVEFLEFVCRYADFYVAEEMPLHLKLPKMLDALLRPHNLPRYDVVEPDSDDSDGWY